MEDVHPQDQLPESDPIVDRLSLDERKLLLQFARQALELAVCGQPLPPLDLAALPAPLSALGASFVTLTSQGQLRGCIGALEPYLPLVEDVREHAVAAALSDYRFPPVTSPELPHIHIEISRLTLPVLLPYDCPEGLLTLLKPGVDGVILKEGLHRATFLPQVWEKLPSTAVFLSHLCQKMGAPGDLWRFKKLQVYTYRVEEFHEPESNP